MALTVINRPQGIILGDCIAATIDEDYAGKATVNTTTPHGLSNGDYVYVTSNVENYNGFWTISVVDGFHFFLLHYPGGNEVVYIVDAAITYCPQESLHTWNAVHLPIVYELESDTFPTNNVSTPRTVSSFTDENGYTNLNLSGSLGTFEELSFIEISGTSELDGVYQIFNKISNSDITINLVYSGSLSFSGGTITLYFSNYHVLVEVWAGIKSGHTWESLKPYEKAATLKLIPDANNRIKFSINEILKSYITIVNNTLLASLPNNTDFWTNFYIKYAEAYDESNGYTITTTEEAMTSDLATFEGFAVNAELEFKNQYSGQLSEYVMTHAAAKFLTLFAIPVIFGCSDDAPDCYQDVSFIKGAAAAILQKEYFTNNVSQLTATESIPEGEGLFRTAIDAECGYNEVKLTLFSDGVIGSLSGIQNTDAGNYSWAFEDDYITANRSNPAWADSRIGYIPITLIDTTPSALQITFDYEYILNSGSAATSFDINVYLLSSGLSQEDLETTAPLSFGTGTITIVLAELTTPIAYLAFRMGFISGTGDVTLRISNVRTEQLSEEKAFRIDCGCSNEEIRLTWLNNMGGFDYWKFTAFKDHIREIKEAGETRVNILPSWPKSYGSDASTIRKQTFRTSGEQFLVRSQHVTLEELQAIAYIKSAVLVQEIVSRSDRRTVIVDEDSFTVFKEDDKLYQISFTITRTNNLPSQRT
jgi:hypothetical protein